MTNRPATLEEYLDYLDQLPRRYAVITERRTPMRRRVWRWLLGWIRY